MATLATKFLRTRARHYSSLFTLEQLLLLSRQTQV